MAFETAAYANENWQEVVKTRCAIMFCEKPVRNNFKSKEQGQDVFDLVPWIIKIPADQMLRVDRPVEDQDKIDFSAEWEAWEATRQSRVLGIPIEQWPAISEGQKLELKAIGVQVVEQIAAWPDSQCSRVLDGQKLRDRARVYVTTGKDAAAMAELRKERDDADSKLSAMMSELAELRRLVEESTTPKAK